MKKYVDVVVQAVAKKDLPLYVKATKTVGKILLEMGALSSSDYLLDDESHSSILLSKSIKLKKGEVLILAMAEFKSKAHRDLIIKKMHDDLRLMKIKMPKMDEKKSMMTGFRTLVDLKK